MCEATTVTRIAPEPRETGAVPGEANTGYMPNTAPGAKGGPNRWEGTHTYTRGGARKRTLAQVQEDAAARIRADREKRRIGVEKLRRNSIASISTSNLPTTPTTSKTVASDQEEEFFDADDADNMPGSNKKKRHGSGVRGEDKDKDPEIMEVDRPRGVDPEMKALLMSIKTDINASTNAAVERIDRRIQANELAIKKVGEDNTAEIKKLQAHVDEAQAKLEQRIDKKLDERDLAIDKKLLDLEKKTATVNVKPRSPKARDQRREEAFHKSRRMLKMWPIRGDDLVDQTKVFMRQKLDIPDARIRTLGQLVVMPSSTRLAKERGEVLVVFEEREDRDYVKSTGINLAGDRQAGMSLHVPGHLLDDFITLNNVGYNIKSAAAQAGVKRSVKFDDATMGLFLEICISGQWKRIYPDQARAALKAAPPEASSNGDRTISTTDLTSLLQGEPVAGVNAVVIPEEEEQQNE